MNHDPVEKAVFQPGHNLHPVSAGVVFADPVTLTARNQASPPAR
jgi:hypothetical protein